MSTAPTHTLAPLRSGPAALLGIAGVIASALLATAAWAGSHSHGHSLSISLDDDEELLACDQVRIRFGDDDAPLPMARAEETFTLARSATPLLQMHLGASGGMTLSGWDRDEYSVTACKAAGATSDARAAEMLRQVDVGFDGGHLSVRGPGDDDWLVYLIVRVPKGAALELQSENSPIDLRDITGSIKARTENGPISLAGCRGDIDVEAQNGPVSAKAGGGRQHLSVMNGPLDIRLEGRKWDGAGIDAHAENGPVSLKIPDGYESGVRLQMSEYSPLQCRSQACDGAGSINADGSRRLDFGPSNPVIVISSENGPVDVKAGTPARQSRAI